MLCSQVKQDLTAYLHGELDKKKLKEIHHHLSLCEDCLLEEIELRKTSRLLQNQPIDLLPSNFDFLLQTKISQYKKQRSDRRSVRKIFWVIAATLLVTLGLEFFIYQYLQSPGRTRQFADLARTPAVFQSYKQDDSSLISRYLAQPEGRVRELPSGKGI